ncbi:diguanylate cyclase [Modestobacter sp. NPDC049651]|uniref:diguanylate cyclase domain-containing protein n=1 Tax=unclassified Modestobacter TaxID=2643866 RepID=UPI0033FF2AB0
MTARPHLRADRLVLAVVAVLTALCVPVSPHGAVPQWDDLVLGLYSGLAAVLVVRRTRRLEAGARGPWWALAVAAGLFCVACLTTSLTPGAFGAASPGDLVLAVAALCPLVACGLLARRVRGSHWPALVLDGLAVTVALLVVTHTLLVGPAVRSGGVPADLRPVVIGYGTYTAVAVGLAAALCTVSARALRRAATATLAATGFIGVAAAAMAAHVLHSADAWQLLIDLATLLALHHGVRAVAEAPPGPLGARRADTEPVVSVTGLAITVGSLVGLPVTVVAHLLLGRTPSALETAGCAAVVVLLLARSALRIRDSGRMSADLLRSEEDFRGLVESSSDGVAIVDADLRLLFTSPAARTLLGLPTAGAHRSLLDLVPTEDRARVERELTEAVGEATPALHLRVLPPAGEPRDLEVTHHERPGSGRRVLHLRDVTTRRRRERELERMAYTDHLTGLPNRAMLFQELAVPARGDRCLLVLDLDGFKAVNDTAGHEAGDLLLVEVARRLQGLVRAEDLVARLGGDEFAVLVTGDVDEAVEAAQRVVEWLGRPYRVGGRTFVVGASVGLTGVRPGGGQLAFREADSALRAAKQAGKGCWRVHDGDRAALAATSSDVAAALAAGEVQLRYDLVADGASGTVYGAHASAVWAHPQLGLLPPAELWAAAERQGRGAELQQWYLRQACAEIAAIDDQATVGVDLPAGQVHADELPGEVTAALAGAGMAPRRLALCFSEEVLQTSSAAFVPALHVIREAGVHLCLTDYGMGSTLWSHLARLPLDTVRIDVRELAAPGDLERQLKVLAAIEASAAAFDVWPVASEVADADLYAAIRARGDMAVQGPVLPTGLTAGGVAAALRHPSRMAMTVPTPSIGG